MSIPLTIVAVIRALPGYEHDVRQALTDLVAPTLAEPGCLQYDLHQDLELPGLFLFYENWASKEAWLTHMTSDHLSDMKAATQGKTADTVIHQMEKMSR